MIHPTHEALALFDGLDESERVAADNIFRAWNNLSGTLTPLSALKVHAWFRHWTDDRLAVIDARKNGETWQQIADALGITRQSVWQRYNDVDRVHVTGNPETEPVED